MRSTRPSKFGTQISVKRADGTNAILNNIYSKSLDTENLGSKQRVKSAAMTKKQAVNKIE